MKTFKTLRTQRGFPWAVRDACYISGCEHSGEETLFKVGGAPSKRSLYHNKKRGSYFSQACSHEKPLFLTIITEKSPVPLPNPSLHLLVLQASNSHQHPLLDRAAPQRAAAVAGQGTDTDGLSQHPLLQRVLKGSSSSSSSRLFQNQPPPLSVWDNSSFSQ